MFGTFFGLHVASSGLRVQQQALDVLSHNISNANTPGYKRQRAVIIEGNAVTGSFASDYTGMSAMGTGVRVENIERMHVDFVDARVRTGLQLSGQWDMESQILGQVQDVFNEPGDTGLQNQLSEFWNAWGNLETLPENPANRIAVINRAEGLAERIRSAYSQLSDTRTQVDEMYRDKADSINLLSQQIADLNEQISSPSSNNFTPNELLNQRDLLVDKLSEIVSVQQFGEGGNDFMLTVGGRVLVNGILVNKVEMGQTADGMTVVQWSYDHDPMTVGSGQLAGIAEVRDNLLPEYMAQLDRFAQTIITEVNQLHRTGFGLDGSTGQDFFVATGSAADIQINPDIKADYRRIAASPDGAPGGSAIAHDIAALRTKIVVDGESITGFYRKMISNIAGDTSMANHQASTYTSMLEQAKIQQQSVSGVSLDEEMTDMIRYQQAYNAAARVITAMDEMLNVLISQTGVVGR